MAAKQKRRNRYSPPFVPTDQQTRMVESMVGFGILWPEIRALIIDPVTDKPIGKDLFEKTFRPALDRGVTKANANVAQSLYDQACGRPAQYDNDGNVLREELPPNPGAAIFWTKARMGWREPPRATEMTGPGGGPIQTQETATVHTYIPANNRDTAEQRSPRKVSRKPR